MNEERPRRRWSRQERLQVVEETLQPGASVAVIARNDGVNANQVFHWRKLYKQGKLGNGKVPSVRLLPVKLNSTAKEHAGSIHIKLDGADIQISGAADPDC